MVGEEMDQGLLEEEYYAVVALLAALMETLVQVSGASGLDGYL